jgi:hypothetical protein
MNLRQSLKWEGYLTNGPCEAFQLVINQYRKQGTARLIRGLLEEQTDLINGLHDLEQFEYPDANRDAWTEYACDRVHEIYLDLVILGHIEVPLQSEIRLLYCHEDLGWYFGTQTWNGYEWRDNDVKLSVMYYDEGKAKADTANMVSVYRSTGGIDDAAISAYYASLKHHPGDHFHAVMMAQWAEGMMA